MKGCSGITQAAFKPGSPYHSSRDCNQLFYPAPQTSSYILNDLKNDQFLSFIGTLLRLLIFQNGNEKMTLNQIIHRIKNCDNDHKQRSPKQGKEE